MTQEFVKETFTYCDSGNLIWRSDRPVNHFVTSSGYSIYMAQRAGKLAGTVSCDRKKTIQIKYKGELKPFETDKLIYLLHHGYIPDNIGFVDGDRHNTKVENLKESDKSFHNITLCARNSAVLPAFAKKYIGIENKTRRGEVIRIVSYDTSEDIMVMFLDTGFKRKTTLSNFKRGVLKQPTSKTVCGVGCLGERFYECIPPEYKPHHVKWQDMVKRCYSGRDCYKAVYSDVYCSDEFLDFSKFVYWLERQTVFGSLQENDLEKDALNFDRSDRKYSADTCVLIPRELNVFFRLRDDKFQYSCNVSKYKNKFKACGYSKTYIGLFATEQEAEHAAKRFVIDHSKVLHAKYKGLIDERILDILYNFEKHYERFYKKN